MHGINDKRPETMTITTTTRDTDSGDINKSDSLFFLLKFLAQNFLLFFAFGGYILKQIVSACSTLSPSIRTSRDKNMCPRQFWWCVIGVACLCMVNILSCFEEGKSISMVRFSLLLILLLFSLDFVSCELAWKIKPFHCQMCVGFFFVLSSRLQCCAIYCSSVSMCVCV